ncbi:MAG: ROK family protein [Myxococcales bacterium]|nr:ROK family protein [Myxococcales bacterium]MCB9534462.1 ROK family protein [Myxococcales bacterium]
MSVHADATIGFDVGGTHIRAVAAWRTGQSLAHGPVVHRRWRDGDAPPSAAQLADAARSLAAEAATAGGVAVPERAAVGFGVAGQLDRRSRTVVNAPNIGWRAFALADALENELGRPVVLANDVNAILAGELSFGRGAGAQTVIAAYLGTGLGGAVAVGGRVVVGAGGNAGELGHVKLAGFDGLCGCGERGCVEALAGGAALLRRLEHDAIARGGRGPRTPAEVDVAAAAGDAYAVELWREVTEGVAHVLSGACTVLNPELLLLGGGVFDNAPTLQAWVAARTAELTLAVCRADLTVASGTLGQLAGPLGAAAEALRR